MTIRIYLVARPAFCVDDYLKFIADEGFIDDDGKVLWDRSKNAHQAEEIVESAGRVCYMSFGRFQSPKTNLEYISHLIEMGHESVLEHVNWSFILTGVSRAFSHQLVRHRPGWAFSQLSQQYHDEHDALFVEPANLSAYPAALTAWRNAVGAARDAYRDILKTLDKAEQANSPSERRELRRAVYSAARSVLPNATETKIFVTANARAVRHFLTVRGAILGDEEMRRVSAALLTLLRTEAPAFFADFEVSALPDNSPVVRHRPNKTAS